MACQVTEAGMTTSGETSSSKRHTAAVQVWGKSHCAWDIQCDIWRTLRTSVTYIKSLSLTHARAHAHTRARNRLSFPSNYCSLDLKATE